MKMKWLIRIVIYLIAFLIIRHLCLMIYYYAPESQGIQRQTHSREFVIKVIETVGIHRQQAVRDALHWSLGLGGLSGLFWYRNYSWFNLLSWLFPSGNLFGLEILNPKLETLQIANKAAFRLCIFLSVILSLVIMIGKNNSGLLPLYWGYTLSKIAVFAILPAWYGVLIYASLKSK